jgi:hypothetical protein
VPKDTPGEPKSPQGFTLRGELHPALTSAFPQLLRFLSIYDILVGVSGCLTYGLPPLWETYNFEVLPRIAPWLIPLIHAALMTSVYCTVILSLERFVRICYLCQEPILRISVFGRKLSGQFFYLKILDKISFSNNR